MDDYYYEFIITKRNGKEPLSKRVVKTSKPIDDYLYELEWFYFKFEYMKDRELIRRDFEIHSRKLTDDESKHYTQYPFRFLFDNQIKKNDPKNHTPLMNIK